MTNKLSLVFSVVLNLFWHTVGFLIAIFYLIYRLLLPKKEGSHPISRFFRKIFEHKKAKTNWGISLLVIILTINFYLSPISNKDVQAKQNTFQPPENLETLESVVITESTYQKPVKGLISQGNYWYHQAIDIVAELEKEVYPIGEGKVISIEYKEWGYGHSVIVDHEQGHQSLYAHLGQIKVETGQKVDKNTALGDIGMTGFTTGPHLHLEIYEKGITINPLEVLPETIW